MSDAQAVDQKDVVVATAPSAAFPIVLTTGQQSAVEQLVSSKSIMSLPAKEVAILGNEAETALHRTLDGFLSRISQFENPKIVKLVHNLKIAVDEQKLDDLADRILDGKPGMLEKIKGLFTKDALGVAWEETKQLAQAKTKTLVDLVNNMDRELRSEQSKLEAEIKSLEQLKDSYRERFGEFVVAVAFLRAFLEKARQEVADKRQAVNVNDPIQRADVDELTDKLQALESRALALEGLLVRLPADHLVIRQLQNAGIATLQETATTAAARFASIKMTLLTIHGALSVRNVQKLSEQGAKLDENLTAVRGKLMKDVAVQAANAPGDNRIAQAEQLRAVIAETAGLVEVVNKAREDNERKFEEARQTFAKARQEMLNLGSRVDPSKQLN